MTIKQTKSGFDQKDPGQGERQSTMSKFNAKLIKHSPQATKFFLWGAFGAPQGGFGGEGAVLDQFDIVFAHFILFFGLASFDPIPIFAQAMLQLVVCMSSSQRHEKPILKCIGSTGIEDTRKTHCNASIYKYVQALLLGTKKQLRSALIRASCGP